MLKDIWLNWRHFELKKVKCTDILEEIWFNSAHDFRPQTKLHFSQTRQCWIGFVSNLWTSLSVEAKPRWKSVGLLKMYQRRLKAVTASGGASTKYWMKGLSTNWNNKLSFIINLLKFLKTFSLYHFVSVYCSLVAKKGKQKLDIHIKQGNLY